ncbi:MAG: hypothetical protein ACYTXI_38365 [Nostoc sp.]
MMYQEFTENIFKFFIQDCNERLEINSRLTVQYNNQIEQLKENALELAKENRRIQERLSSLEVLLSKFRN